LSEEKWFTQGRGHEAPQFESVTLYLRGFRWLFIKQKPLLNKHCQILIVLGLLRKVINTCMAL